MGGFPIRPWNPFDGIKTPGDFYHAYGCSESMWVLLAIPIMVLMFGHTAWSLYGTEDFVPFILCCLSWIPLLVLGSYAVNYGSIFGEDSRGTAVLVIVTIAYFIFMAKYLYMPFWAMLSVAMAGG